MHLQKSDTEWRQQLLLQECMPEEGVPDAEKLWASIADQLNVSNNEALHPPKSWIKYAAVAVLLVSILLASIPIKTNTLLLSGLKMRAKVAQSSIIILPHYEKKSNRVDLIPSKQIILLNPENPIKPVIDLPKYISIVEAKPPIVIVDSLQYSSAHLTLLQKEIRANAAINIATLQVKKWKIVHINELRNPPEIQAFAEKTPAKSNDEQWEINTSTPQTSTLFPKSRKLQLTALNN